MPPRGPIARRYGVDPRSAFPDGPGLGFDLGRKSCLAGPIDARMSWVEWPPGSRRRPMWLVHLLGRGRGLADRIPYSLVALLARFAVAGVFWRSGQTKVEGFFMVKENTFFLFREEYKVPLLPPDTAAYLSTVAEHVFPVLLVIGLASRLSALG